MMNRQEILEMVEGAEMDATISEKIFNWKWIDYKWYDGAIKKILAGNSFIPSGDDFNNFNGDKDKLLFWGMTEYSIRIDKAWILVELLRKNGIYLTIAMDNEIYNVSAYSTEYMDDIEEIEGKHLPLLICKIALLCNMYDFVNLEEK